MKQALIAIMILISMNIQAQTPKCRAYTIKGTPCKRTVVKEGYCSQHYTMKTGKVILGKPNIDLPEEWAEMSTNSYKPDVMVVWRDSITNTIHLGYKH